MKASRVSGGEDAGLGASEVHSCWGQIPGVSLVSDVVSWEVNYDAGLDFTCLL